MSKENNPLEEDSDILKSLSEAIGPSVIAQAQYQPNANSIFQQSAIPLAANGVAMGTNSSMSINTGSNNWNMFVSDYKDEEKKTYEFKLVNGVRIIKSLSYSDIEAIVELSTTERKFSWKYPFSREETRKFTRVKLKNSGNKEFLDIDCNIKMFMRIIGRDYLSWNKAVMTESIKNGTQVN